MLLDAVVNTYPAAEQRVQMQMTEFSIEISRARDSLTLDTAQDVG